MSNLLLFQVRLGSSRFPNKPLYKLDEKQPSLLEIIIKRFLLHSKAFSDIGFSPLFIIPFSDDKLAHEIVRFGLPVFFGDDHPPNRFRQVLAEFEPEYHVRICCDNPFLDFEYMAWFVNICHRLKLPYAQPYVKDKPSTLSQAGIAFEFLNSKLLLNTFEVSDHALNDEHVTTSFYGRNSINPWKNLLPKTDYFDQSEFNSEIRLTIDYRRDLELIKKIYDCLGENIFLASTRDILNMILTSPELTSLSLSLGSLARAK